MPTTAMTLPWLYFNAGFSPRVKKALRTAVDTVFFLPPLFFSLVFVRLQLSLPQILQLDRSSFFPK